MNETRRNDCPVCASSQVETFIELTGMPVFCNVHWSDRTAALAAPRGDIELAFCRQCGHVFNRTFRAELLDYDADYDNSLHYSPRFQEYAEDLARDLVERHDLHGKQLLEIACGKGDFLRLLCSLGDNRGTGFDPSYEPEREGDPDPDGLTFVRDYYGEKYADLQADFIYFRHALEHFPAPTRFLSDLRRTIGTRTETVVFCEVPNALFTLKDLSIWDIIYEHPSYFGAESLAYAFRLAGFEVQRVAETFAGQFLIGEAVPAAPTSAADGNPALIAATDGLDQLAAQVEKFTASYAELLATWRSRLATWRQEGRRCVVWGGGSKGVMFLNLLAAETDLAYIVDINPHKQNKYVAGSGQRIVAPEFLADYRPDVVIVMNPVYRAEIARTLQSLQVPAEIHDV